MQYLYRFNNLADAVPINTVAEYQEFEERIHELRRYNDEVYGAEIRRQKEAGKQPDRRLYEESEKIKQQVREIDSEINRRTPFVLASRCPYCDCPIYQKVAIFSLKASFWHMHSGSRYFWVWTGESYNPGYVYGQYLCPHLFCIDGALNLHGHTPDAQSPRYGGTIHMAAEVPFVKPRVLELPTMLGVMNSFPIMEKYTAYTIGYFTQEQPHYRDFCIPWHCTEWDSTGEPQRKLLQVGKREDIQDYDLLPWVERGKLSWINPISTRVKGAPPDQFPYLGIEGRRHPYRIEESEVIDLPSPQGGPPVIRTEY